jgi:hypothetical protein
MLLKKRIICLVLFFLLNNNCVMHAFNVTPPSVGLGGAAAPVITAGAQAAAAAVEQIVGPVGETLSYVFAKECMRWVPALIIAGGSLWAGKYILAYIVAILSNITESIQNVTHAPSRVKDIKEQLEVHIETFGTWKDNEFISKITELKASVISNIKEFVQELFEKYSKQQNKQIQHVVNEAGAVVSKKIEKSHELHQDNSQSIQRQEKILTQVRDALIDLSNHLQQVPNNVEEVKEATGGMCNAMGTFNYQTSSSTTMGQQQNLWLNGSPTGSGIFANFVRPELNKMREEQSTLHQRLTELEQQQGGRKDDDAPILKNAMSNLLDNQKAMQATMNKCVQLCVVLCNSLVQQQDISDTDMSEMLLLPKALDTVTPYQFGRDFMPEPVIVLPRHKLGE